MKRHAIIRLVIGLIIITLITLALEKLIGLNTADIKNWLLAFGPLAPIVYGLLIYTCLVIPFNPISEYALVILAAYIFPLHYSIPATFIADVLVLFTNYYLGKKFGWKIVKKFYKKGSDIKQLEGLIKKINLPLIFSLRFIPYSTALGIEVVSYASAMANIPFKKFFISSIIPWIILNLTFFLSAGYLKNLHPLLVFLPVIILATIPLVIVYLHRKKLF